VDKIEKAIERARQQRQGHIGQTSRYDIPLESVGGQEHVDGTVFSTVERKAREPLVDEGLSIDEVLSGNYDSPTKKAVLADESLTSRKDLVEATDLATEQDSDTSFEQLAYSKTTTFPSEEESLRQNRVIAGINSDKRAEVYRQLRTKVRQILDKNGWNTLAITSARENAGKTLTATNLAIALSREVSHTVLLVDLDLRDPSVHKALDVKVEHGLVDVLSGKAEVEDVLINPGFPRLVVLPGRALGHYSSELLSSPAMKELVLDIRHRYPSRVIIFDLPPLLCNDDALLFTPTIDAAMLVVEEGVTTADELHRCEELLSSTQLIGTVLNKARGVV